ncbi:ParB family protein [Arthrobacter sp. D2-10]
MSKRKPASFTPYFTQEDAGRVRAAFLSTGAAEGYASVSDLIEKAVLKEVRRLQRKHNGGKPFEPVPPGALRTGRRNRDEEKHRTE